VNILMMTNTYTPFVGGVERSVETFTGEYRRRGHQVIIVAPTYEDMPEDEEGVVRIPAIQHFNGTDFSVRLPIPGVLSSALADFEPDIVHSHHPYLIGDTARRVAAKHNTPLVFTFHTFYERYTHYVPGDSPALKRFTAALCAGYANLADQVFAPSESVAEELRRRGVRHPIEVVPTGIDYDRFTEGDGSPLRKEAGVSRDDFVVGFISRIAPEKNMDFLCRSVTAFLKKEDRAHFFLVGSGPSEDDVMRIFQEEGLDERFHYFGTLEGQDLINAYHALDVFAFASHTETQGLVLMEAMAAGVPVVGVDASGVREVVVDHSNGRLLPSDDEAAFCDALQWVASLSDEERHALNERARRTARSFGKDRCAEKALERYEILLAGDFRRSKEEAAGPWDEAMRRIRVEWDTIANIARATGALLESEEEGEGETRDE